MNISLGVVSALIANIGSDPIQISCTETHNAVARLPFEDFSAHAEALIDVVGGSAFQFADEVADQDCWRDASGDMNMVVGTADFMDECSGCVD